MVPPSPRGPPRRRRRAAPPPRPRPAGRRRLRGRRATAPRVRRRCRPALFRRREPRRPRSPRAGRPSRLREPRPSRATAAAAGLNSRRESQSRRIFFERSAWCKAKRRHASAASVHFLHNAIPDRRRQRSFPSASNGMNLVFVVDLRDLYFFLKTRVIRNMQCNNTNPCGNTTRSRVSVFLRIEYRTISPVMLAFSAYNAKRILNHNESLL